MANEKYWDHLTLKDGSQVKFVPPAPNGAKLGGISATDLEQISTNKNDIYALENKDGTGTAGQVWTATASGAGWATPTKILTMTQEEYDLITPDEDTIYIIVEAS